MLCHCWNIPLFQPVQPQHIFLRRNQYQRLCHLLMRNQMAQIRRRCIPIMFHRLTLTSAQSWRPRQIYFCRCCRYCKLYHCSRWRELPYLLLSSLSHWWNMPIARHYRQRQTFCYRRQWHMG